MTKTLCIVLGCLIFSGCAGKKPGGYRKEHKSPPLTSPSQVSGPARDASNAVLEEGKGALEQGDLERAADNFQEAVTLDPTNGAGFYYLALLHFKKGEYDQSAVFLEKADSLLAGQEDWIIPLEELKRDLSQ